MKNKDPYKRLTKLIHDFGYDVEYEVVAKMGPFTSAIARLTPTENHRLREFTINGIVGFGISRCSVKDKQNDAIGNQVAIGKAMTAALLRVCGEEDLHVYSVLMG